MINARAETVATKPSFRNAFKKRRCLIPADGFYEWKRQNGDKQPFFISLPDGKPFAFAGLWEICRDKENPQSIYRSCTIITRDAGESLMEIRNRMPAVCLRMLTKSGWKPETRTPKPCRKSWRKRQQPILMSEEFQSRSIPSK